MSATHSNDIIDQATTPAIEGYCPVAYFAAGKPIRGTPEHASAHRGETYHFVSAEAKAAFDDDPERYVPAFGGSCAFGASIEKTFPVDPTSFKIVDGRLLLFLKNEETDARQLWNEGDEAERLAKADAHWKRSAG